MKTAFKLIGGLLIGIIIGLFIALVITVGFTDTTLSDFIRNTNSGLPGIAGAAVISIVAFLLSIFILILSHEAGHLLCGILSGYKFVSFRIFDLTFIRKDGKVRIRKFSIAGTGGQCLLTPPEIPLKNLPTAWYNAGGVLANLILLLIALPLYLLDSHPYINVAVTIFVITDLFLIIINGIPMKVGGIGNDAYNMLHLHRNLTSKRAFAIQLRTNALIQNGIRPKDMPDEWFEDLDNVDYHNPFEVSIPFMLASRYIDEEKWDDAYNILSRLYQHKNEIMQIYANEISCELAFCAMVTSRIDEARTILDSGLMKYVEAYKNVMSSKQRLLFCKALFLENDRDKAMDIYRTLLQNQDRYLMQGEVKSDIDIMRNISEAA